MSLEILQSGSQIQDARRVLRSRRLSLLPTPWARLATRLHLLGSVPVGDPVKSWDVLKTVEFIEQNASRLDWILDIGAYASEVPWILHELGFSKIAALDLNTELARMPYSGSIRYVVGDFLRGPFRGEVFSVISAISVIEHGLDADRLLFTIQRLLRPGGYFVASFDYWNEKIDTSGVSIFGLDWTIFSARDLKRFLGKAEAAGLVAEGPLSFETCSKTAQYKGFGYTFAWLALRKRG